ncbi:hypothetical protein ACNAN0_10730 [Agrilactobacillus fermenti]|uniref:hypothetical protein n=1 Tax=Agrilactobacillus fermenti TaxID=2586909 RepID=UPI003A5C003B
MSNGVGLIFDRSDEMIAHRNIEKNLSNRVQDIDSNPLSQLSMVFFDSILQTGSKGYEETPSVNLIG